jgi:hypothetical protein
MTAVRLDTVRQDPDAIHALYHECRDDLIDQLGPAFRRLSEGERQLVFCTVLAHALAPWGSDSTECRFPQLLQCSTLNCGNYGILTIHMARALRVSADVEGRLRLVGWEGGIVGNHQMLFLERGKDATALVLDPTLGLVALADFDTVASGKPVPAEHVVIFNGRDQVRALEDEVVAGLTYGLFRPSDLLYYFESLDHLMLRYGHPRIWPTPSGIRWRERNPDENPNFGAVESSAGKANVPMATR